MIGKVTFQTSIKYNNQSILRKHIPIIVGISTTVLGNTAI